MSEDQIKDEMEVENDDGEVNEVCVWMHVYFKFHSCGPWLMFCLCYTIHVGTCGPTS